MASLPGLPTGASPLMSIYTEIEGALNAHLYYVALSVSVAFPDICASLEGKAPTNWQTYKDWFNANAAHRFRSFGADECYELRCGVVHQARFSGASKKKHSSFDVMFFTLPNRQQIQIGEMVAQNIGGRPEKVLSMSLVDFCQKMVASARAWESSKENDATVQSNMQNLVRVRPFGLPPYIKGVPVIA